MNRTLTLALPGLLLGLGALAGAALYIGGQSAPARAEATERVQRVEVIDVRGGDAPLTVRGTGAVAAAQSVDLVPQVMGNVVWVASDLRPGRRFTAGQTIARIDDTIYRASVAEAKVRLARAEQEVALEQGRGQVADFEQRLTGIGSGEDLVLRKPQLAAAQAEIEAAKANLARAERDLRNTRLKAPFDGVLVQESLDLGQVVNTTASVGRITGTKRALVQLAVDVDSLAHLDIPDLNVSKGASAQVWLVGQSDGASRTGSVLGVTGEVDATTRTATLLVGIESPLDPTEGPLMMAGSFVTVEIDGQPVANATTIPAAALVEGSGVWTVDAEHRLDRRTVEVIWRDESNVIVRGDLGTGLIVTQPPAVPLDGLPVEFKLSVASLSDVGEVQ
ncbi:MAG: efflux RND transporter periplasmic adaptor subunit [Myxococcota bacterium]